MITHGNSAYLVVIQPQLVQQQSMTYINTNRSYYSITDLYLYTSCFAVALIVVELRPGRHYCHAHMHLYIGCCYYVLCKFYHKHQNIICVVIYAICETHFHLFNTYRLCSAPAIMLFFEIRFK